MNASLALVLLAALLTTATLAALLPGLWTGGAAGTGGGPRDSGVGILRDQLAGVDRDLAAARIDAATAHRLRTEIGRRLIEESEGAAATPWRSGPARGAAIALAIGLPLGMAMMYGVFGQPAALTQAPRTDPPVQATVTQVEAMASQMLQALQARDAQGQGEPGDAAAWAMVGRTLASVQRFAEAEKAMARALALRPDDASLLADRADLLALLQGGSAAGEPMALIQRALAIDPDHPKALALAGSAAWNRGETARAEQHWQRALAQLPPDSALARNLEASLAEARQSRAGRTPAAPVAPSPGTTSAAAPTSPRIAGPATLRAASVRGRVTLAPALAAGLRPDDTVFIVARAAQGPRMPLAIVRLRVADLPADFTLDDDRAMDPALRLSRFQELVVTARVSRGGEALPRSGDAVGAPVNATLGARDLVLRIDRMQP